FPERRKVASPRVVEVRAEIPLAARSCVESMRAWAHLIGAQSPSEPSGVELLSAQVSPRGLIESHESVGELFRAEPVDGSLYEDTPAVREQLHAERRITLSACCVEFDAGVARAGRPLAAGEVSDRE